MKHPTIESLLLSSDPGVEMFVQFINTSIYSHISLGHAKIVLKKVLITYFNQYSYVSSLSIYFALY